jgi:hypothetical protein
MKSNIRVILALVICVSSVALFIYLVALKDSINGVLILLYPLVGCAGFFGVGLLMSVKAGLHLSLTLFTFMAFIFGMGEICNDLLKTDSTVAVLASLAIAFGAAYLAYKKVLPRVLRISKDEDENQSESQRG